MRKKILMAVYAVFAFTIFNSKSAQGQEAEDTTQATINKMWNDLEVLKRLKVTGYYQVQFQFADSSGIYSFAGGSFPSKTDKRFELRRGRLKFTYTTAYGQFVLQPDYSENGIGVRDAFYKVTEPWLQFVTLTAGIFNRPFGYEVLFSSSDRETPERGRLSQIIFNNERDLGAMLTLQAPKTSRFNWLRLDAGMFNGTGLGARDFDLKKDFIGRINMTRSLAKEKIKLGIGASFYDGAYRIDNDTVFTVNNKIFEVGNDGNLNNTNYGKRQYMGADMQLSIDWPIGITTLRGEFIQGELATPSVNTTNPQATFLYPTAAVKAPAYMRNFNGAYFYFVQNIGRSKHTVVVKYDWFDPNTKVSGNQIDSKNKFTAGDVKFTTIGLGYLFKWDQNVKLMLYYDMVTNENTNLSGYGQDVKDNVFTIRVQYRF